MATSRQHQRIGLQGFEFSSWLREARAIERHLFDGQRALVGHVLDRRQPLDQHAFLQGLFDFKVVRRHLCTVASVDDDRFGRAQPFGRARNVERGVAAAIYHHATAKHRLFLALHAPQYRNRIEHVSGLPRGNVCALGDVCADGEERGIKAARGHRVDDIRDLRVQFEFDTHVEDALHLAIEHVARQSILGNSKSHHAAGKRTGLDDLDAVAKAPKLVRCGQSRGSGTDNENALATFGLRGRKFPSKLQRFISEKALHRIDAHGLIDFAAVAGGLARVIADASHDRRQRIVFRQCMPRRFIVAGLGVI
jgi:hypothetical protein